jgi:hypothetical protein
MLKAIEETIIAIKTTSRTTSLVANCLSSNVIFNLLSVF